jgi:hypothetical protein
MQSISFRSRLHRGRIDAAAQLGVVGDRPVIVDDPDEGDRLLLGIGGQVVDLVLDVPVDALAQAEALAAAAGLEHQVGVGEAVVLVVAVGGDRAQAVVGELLRGVALLAGLTRRAQLTGADRVLVGDEGGGDDVFDVARLAGDARGDEALADVAVDAVDARVRRGQVSGVLGWHGVAGGAAKHG